MSDVRLLRPGDVSDCLRLSRTAGWNQTEADWRRILRLAPEGCLGIEIEGAVRATATLICYGQDVGWIGMVLSQPEYRGRGLARSLMKTILGAARQAGVRVLKLDATSMGRPLYQRLGFVDEQPIERWQRPAGNWPEKAPLPAIAEPDLRIDRSAFGANREHVLASLAGWQVGVADGFAMGRAGANAAYFGPCIACSEAAAASLVRAFGGAHANEPVYWDLLPSNRSAQHLARELGFAPARHLTRMSLPGDSRLGDNSLTYAIAGFEYG